MSNGKTICTVCNYIYDEVLGEQSQNIPPSVRFDDLPDSWQCPVCNSSKEMFQPCSCVSLHTYEQTCVKPNGPITGLFSSQTVGQLVADRPERACILEQYNIDYCCGGKKTLEEACKQKGVSIAEVTEKLAAAEQDLSEKEPDWKKTSLKQLIDHIVACYHQPLRDELPRISQLAEKVARVHGANHPEMVELFKVFTPFRQQLEMHMQKEEMILFPGIAGIEAGGSPRSFGCGGGVDHPIEVMTQEHDDAGEALAKMRQLTNDYTPPADACNRFKVLLHSLAKLELDMHQHVHKENNILFPRASELAKAAPVAAHSNATSHGRGAQG